MFAALERYLQDSKRFKENYATDLLQHTCKGRVNAQPQLKNYLKNATSKQRQVLETRKQGAASGNLKLQDIRECIIDILSRE